MIADFYNEIPAEVVAEEMERRRLQRLYNSGRNCRDPEHWGCPKCEPDEFKEIDK